MVNSQRKFEHPANNQSNGYNSNRSGATKKERSDLKPTVFEKMILLLVKTFNDKPQYKNFTIPQIFSDILQVHIFDNILRTALSTLLNSFNRALETDVEVSYLLTSSIEHYKITSKGEYILRYGVYPTSRAV